VALDGTYHLKTIEEGSVTQEGFQLEGFVQESYQHQFGVSSTQ
jgi:hypothetical protein